MQCKMFNEKTTVEDLKKKSENLLKCIIHKTCYFLPTGKQKWLR